MLFKLIATAALAFAVAGMVMLINRLSRGALPRWVLPASIAASIVGFQIFDEYNWYSRKQSELSGQFLIIDTHRAKRFWRPWTYLNAPVSTIMAVNKENFSPLEGTPGITTSVLYTVSYLGVARHLPFAFDCAEGRFGPMLGEVEDVPWAELPEAARIELCAS